MNTKDKSQKNNEGLFSAISAGFFLLLLGTIFVLNPNLFGETIDLLRDIAIVDVPNTDISFLGIESPPLHLAVYEAAFQISIALVVFQVIILGLRFVFQSSRIKRSETVGNIVYWSGTSYLIHLFLIENTQWFVFWSTILIIVGISLIIRAIFMAVTRIIK
ncbi:hypothetical protein KJN74_03225 [Candidatus Bathyarchaeota archaeon]|nr:hypothetical protein [Candidatus Bathyarchaeota archaeon]